MELHNNNSCAQVVECGEQVQNSTEKGEMKESVDSLVERFNRFHKLLAMFLPDVEDLFKTLMGDYITIMKGISCSPGYAKRFTSNESMRPLHVQRIQLWKTALALNEDTQVIKNQSPEVTAIIHKWFLVMPYANQQIKIQIASLLGMSVIDVQRSFQSIRKYYGSRQQDTNAAK
jgi:hypothetical protein